MTSRQCDNATPTFISTVQVETQNSTQVPTSTLHMFGVLMIYIQSPEPIQCEGTAPTQPPWPSTRFSTNAASQESPCQARCPV